MTTRPTRREYLLLIGISGTAGCSSILDDGGSNGSDEREDPAGTPTGGTTHNPTSLTPSPDGTESAADTDTTTGGTKETTTGSGTTTAGGLGDNAPMYQYDAANTGHNPDASGPTSSVSPAWSSETGGQVFDTPSVAGGNVYVGSQNGTVYALNRAGKERWTYDAPGPVMGTAVGDGGVYLGYGRQDTEKGFAALSTNGEELWTVAAESRVVGAPTVHDGTVYVTEYSAALYAIDTATGEVEWSADTGAETPATPSVADGTVYLGVQNAVQAYDAASGDRQWTFDVSGDSNFTTPAPAATDGAVFFGDFEGTLRAVESDGTERWSADVADFTFSSPAVADGTVYLAATTSGDSNTASVYAYDAADGSEVWSAGIEPSLASAPVIAGETLYVSGRMFDVHALTAADGEQLWSSPETERGAADLIPPPAAADDTVYVGSYDTKVYALRSD